MEEEEKNEILASGNVQAISNNDFRYLPHSHCLYCGISNPACIAKCEVCNYWFCNSSGQIKQKSHIFLHSTQSKHRIFSTHIGNTNHSGIFECIYCKENNIFKLELSQQGEIICRPCTFEHRVNNRLKFSQFIEQEKVNPKKITFPTVDEERKAQSLQNSDIRKIETNIACKKDPYAEISSAKMQNGPLTKIKLYYYSSEDYYRCFKKIIENDYFCMKMLVDSYKSSRLVVKIDDNANGSFYYPISDRSYKLRKGQLITLKLENETILDAVVLSLDERSQIVYIKLIHKFKDLEAQDYGFILCTDVCEVPYNRMLNALTSFKAHDISKTLEDLVLGKSLVSHKIIENLPNILEPPGLEKLNESQILCVHTALTSAFSLIQGPPGTGKTQTSAAIVYNLSKNLKKNHKVLVCSSSNASVDNLVERISKTGVKVLKVSSKIRENIPSTIDSFCLHTKLKQYITDYHPQFINTYIMKSEYDEYLTENDKIKYYQYTNKGLENIFSQYDVICCTNIVAGDERLDGLHFDCVLVDEANQANEPEIMVPLVKGYNQFILVGDQMQLGPQVICRESKLSGLDCSLFTRLIDLGVKPNILSIQYRMHPALSKFPSEFFYNNILIDGVSENDRKDEKIGPNFWPTPSPLVFLDHKSFEGNSETGRSFLNPNEAFIILECIVALNNAGVEEKRILVLTPYEGQKMYLIDLIKSQNFDIQVCNIDEFQGKEMDYVILSLVRSNDNTQLGFLCDYRRMNVAITRAKYGMVVIGSTELMGKSELWGGLVKSYAEKGLIFDGNFGRLAIKEVIVEIKQAYCFKKLYAYYEENRLVA